MTNCKLTNKMLKVFFSKIECQFYIHLTFDIILELGSKWATNLITNTLTSLFRGIQDSIYDSNNFLCWTCLAITTLKCNPLSTLNFLFSQFGRFHSRFWLSPGYAGAINIHRVWIPWRLFARKSWKLWNLVVHMQDDGSLLVWNTLFNYTKPTIIKNIHND